MLCVPGVCWIIGRGLMLVRVWSKIVWVVGYRGLKGGRGEFCIFSDM